MVQTVSFKLPSLKNGASLCLWKRSQFELATEKDAEKSAKGVVSRNTEKNDHWALNTWCG